MHILLHPFGHIRTTHQKKQDVEAASSVLHRLLTPTTRSQLSGFFGVGGLCFFTTLGTGQFPSNTTETAHDGQITLGAFEALRMPRSTWTSRPIHPRWIHPDTGYAAIWCYDVKRFEVGRVTATGRRGTSKKSPKHIFFEQKNTLPKAIPRPSQISPLLWSCKLIGGLHCFPPHVLLLEKQVPNGIFRHLMIYQKHKTLRNHMKTDSLIIHRSLLQVVGRVAGCFGYLNTEPNRVFGA